jgi:hypothetical protein
MLRCLGHEGVVDRVLFMRLRLADGWQQNRATSAWKNFRPLLISFCTLLRFWPDLSRSYLSRSMRVAVCGEQELASLRAGAETGLLVSHKTNLAGGQ